MRRRLPPATRPVLQVDFDGVIHQHRRGWRSVEAIDDEPVPGAIAFLREAVEYGWCVAIYSGRSQCADGIAAMQAWLARHADGAGWLDLIEWPDQPPNAQVKLDDRALTFTGAWPGMEALAAFRPWNRPRD